MASYPSSYSSFYYSTNNMQPPFQYYYDPATLPLRHRVREYLIGTFFALPVKWRIFIILVSVIVVFYLASALLSIPLVALFVALCLTIFVIRRTVNLGQYIVGDRLAACLHSSLTWVLTPFVRANAMAGSWVLKRIWAKIKAWWTFTPEARLREMEEELGQAICQLEKEKKAMMEEEENVREDLRIEMSHSQPKKTSPAATRRDAQVRKVTYSQKQRRLADQLAYLRAQVYEYDLLLGNLRSILVSIRTASTNALAATTMNQAERLMKKLRSRYDGEALQGLSQRFWEEAKRQRMDTGTIGTDARQAFGGEGAQTAEEVLEEVWERSRS